MEAGTVKSIRNTGSPFPGLANKVVVQGSDGMYTLYLHVFPSVVVNQTVSAGQKIGTVDNTGQTSGPHAHICRSPDQSCTPKGVDYELPACPL
jgi:murein DD-endopeptidase MepM/ murein hydrolase activator NlpD